MSTARPPALESPLLVDGQRLTQPEFHARYEAAPSGTWAELITGVVRMSSPVGRPHGRGTGDAYLWVRYYAEFTPGVEALDNTSTVLNGGTEVQPDVQLRILPEAGGQTRGEDLILGAPELVVEVAHSSRRLDLGAKLAEYERAGVLDYVVRCIEPDEVRWHARRGGRLEQVPPDADGLYRSAAFPGLWLDPATLLAGDTRALRAAVDRGVATPEHAEFARRLAQTRAGG